MSRVWAWLVWWFVGRRRTFRAWEHYRIIESNCRRIEHAELALPVNQRSLRVLEAVRRDRDTAHQVWVDEMKKRP